MGMRCLYENFIWSINSYFDDDWSIETHDADWIYKNLSSKIPTYCTKNIARQDTKFVSDRTNCEITNKKFYNE